MKNYSEKIFELLGVAPEEYFRIRNNFTNQLQPDVYMITPNLTLSHRREVDTNEYEWAQERGGLEDILSGFSEIVPMRYCVKRRDLVAIAYALECGCNYIAVDSNSQTYAYGGKPVKDESAGSWDVNENDGMPAVQIQIPVSFASWQDEEPVYIGDFDQNKAVVEE